MLHDFLSLRTLTPKKKVLMSRRHTKFTDVKQITKNLRHQQQLLQRETIQNIRLLHKLLGYLSKVAPKIFKSCPKVAHLTKKLLKSCFLSIQKNQLLPLMKLNLCTSIRIIYLFIYSFLLAYIPIPTEMIFQSLHLCILFYISLWESVLNIGNSPLTKIMLFIIQ